MKILHLLALIFLLICSCKPDPTKKHPKIKQMEAASVHALDKMTKHICSCIYEHPTQEMIKTAKSIITAQNDQQRGIEEQHLLKPVLKAMQELKNCMESEGPSVEDNKSLQKDLKKLLSEDGSKAEEEKLDITVSFLNKNCPENAVLYAEFIETVQMLLQVLSD